MGVVGGSLLRGLNMVLVIILDGSNIMNNALEWLLA
jgi:hypothetical protein